MLKRFLFYLSFFFYCAFIQAQSGGCISGNCMDGYGRFEWTSGEEYVGNFKQGRMDGYGVFYWKSKRKFVGNWTKGKMNGEGTLYYENGLIKRGVWKYNTFVRLIRGSFTMSKENIRHGQEQLKKMLQDRPKMNAIVEEEDIIWQWTVHKLAGEDIHTPIYWQAKAEKNFPIPTDVNAVHAYPTAKSDGRVWIKNNTDSEEMWAGLIYELHNIKNGSEFQAIEEDAKHWLCSKEEYIIRYAQLEYQAAKETVQFYKNIWVPYCESKNIRPTPQLWFYYIPDTFEKWQESFQEKSGYPWHPYAGYYDRLVKDIVKNY